jgi:hypothetical protein
MGITSNASIANKRRICYPFPVDEGRKRVLLIAASILAARKLAQSRHRIDAEFNEAQIVFANANARMELAPPGDDEANKEAEAANRRLLALFRQGWKKNERLLFRCYQEYKKRLCYHHRADS